MLFKENDIQNLDKVYRLNLINSITGVKPVNLIGTKSMDEKDNLAIFSSVVHLGSNPAQIGLVMRPQHNGMRDTFANIKETDYYTINQVSKSFIKKAHYTSAKLEKDESEFDVMNIEREFINDFHAPFVAESPVKIGMKHLESIDLSNGCIFIVGEVNLVQVPDESINNEGRINLEQYNGVGLSGLNSYYSLEHISTFPYVRVEEIPDFRD